MSGKKTRHFYNQLLAMSDARYLEIGTWKGSSVCSAMYGNHTHESHYRALTHYIGHLDDIFIYIVDDWNSAEVRQGTSDAIQRLGLEILYEKVIRLTEDNSHTEIHLAKSTWWNGIYAAILKKPTNLRQ